MSTTKKIVALQTERDQLYAELHRVQAENQRLRGLQPEFPPRPPEGSGLPRYGLRWNGPQFPLSVPMDDGYWTPWHLAAQLHAELEAIRGQQPDAVSVPRELAERLAGFVGAHPSGKGIAEELRALLTTKTDGVV